MKRTSPITPGTRLRGRYELRALLGEGGMGAVYRAFDLLRQREIALKVLHDHLAPETSQRLLQELALQEEASHPGVVRTYDADQDTDSGTTFFTMALIEGPSLEELLRSAAKERQYPPFALPDIVGLCRRMTSIFGAIHQRGILHGDIKPSHILFATPADSQAPPNQALWRAQMLQAPLYLIDFGLARPLTWSMLPTGGAGTPAIMAPEQWQPDAPLTPATDVYALGLLLYRLLTGAPHTGGQLPPPSVWLRTHGHPTHASPESEAMDRIIARALAYLPGDRYPDANALWDDIDRHCTSAEQPEKNPKSRRESRDENAATEAIVYDTSSTHNQQAQDQNKDNLTQRTPAQSHKKIPVTLDPTARSIDLSGQRIELATLEQLSLCTSLRHLSLCETGLRDDHLVYLASLHTLETLQCSGNAINGTGLIHLQRLRHLRMLSLSCNPLQAPTLQHIDALPSLRWLSLWRCPLNNQALHWLRRMTQLHKLYMSETLLDDKALPVLKELHNLQELALHRTQISANGMRQLQAALPHCRILSAASSTSP